MYILNNDEEIIGILENDGSQAASYWEDEISEKLNDAYLTLNFKMDGNHETAALIEVKKRIVATDDDGNLILFIIEEVQDHTAEDGSHYKEVYAEHAALELLGKVIRPQTYGGFTAEQFYNSILENTAWDLGIVEWAGTADIVFDDYTNAVDAILKGREVFNSGELRYRVSFNGPKLAGRYIDLVQRRGEDRGGQVTYQHNMVDLVRTEDGKEIYTALVGIAQGQEGTEGYMTFADVSADDKPAGQDWIGDDDALQRFGIRIPETGELTHFMGVYTYDGEQELTPEMLLDKTREQLAIKSKPGYTYETTAKKLGELTGLSPDDFRLGDTITVQNLDLEPPLLLEARIIEARGPLDDLSNRDFVIGEYRDIYSEHQYAIIKKLRNAYLRESAKWSTTGARVIRSNIAPDDPDAIWIDTSGDVDIVKTLNPETGVWEAAAPTLASQILYTNGFTLEDLRPAAKGADVTALNTSADTAKVAGTTASAVRDNASNGAQANTKIQNEVGSGTIETTSGSQTKANSAQTLAEWYAQVRTGVNLITNIDDLSLPAPYTWEMGTSPDGTPAKLIKKEHIAGATVDNSNLLFPEVKIDPNKTYLYEVWIKQMDKNSSYYIGRKEYLADQLTENQSGNGPNMVSARTVTTAEVGTWVKHFGLIAPHDAGIEDSHTVPNSDLTRNIDHKWYNANSAYTAPKIILTYGVTDPTKGAVTYATKFGLYEVSSNDSIYEAIESSSNTAEENAKNHADSVAATVEQNAKDYASDASNITVGTLSADRLYGETISGKKVYIVDLDAGSITSGFLSFNYARGGVLKLGSITDGNGILQVLSDNETVVGEINAVTGASFSTLLAGDIISDSIVNRNYQNLSFFVDPLNGDDAAAGTSWTYPLKTIQEAINRIPKYNEGAVVIQAHYSNATNMTEEIEIDGIVGSGYITIDFQRTTNTLYGSFTLKRCKQEITFKRGRIITAGNTGHAILADICDSVIVQDSLIYCGGRDLYGFYVAAGYGNITNTKIYDATQAAITSSGGSRVEVRACDGNGNNRGLWVVGPSIINLPDGTTAPAGTANTFKSDGGQIWAAGTYTFPSAPKTETPPAPDTTYTWTATSAKSWRPQGWRSDNGFAYQGEWSGNGNHRGLWFFNSADIRSKLAGKTIKRVRVYLTRRAEGGNSGNITPTFWMHSYDSPPSDMPLLAASALSNQAFAWGSAKWVTLPNNFGVDLQSGARRGIGIYDSDGSPYGLFNADLKLEIVAGS
ncbi:phage tail spike protein [Priestia megaterium]